MKSIFQWKIDNTPEKTVDNFEFKSVKTPPKNKHFNAFEANLYDIVRNIKFKRVSSEFQRKLSKDIKRINEDPLLFNTAVKTSNLYQLSKDNYNKLLTDNMTKSYKKLNTAAMTNIN